MAAGAAGLVFSAAAVQQQEVCEGVSCFTLYEQVSRCHACSWIQEAGSFVWGPDSSDSSVFYCRDLYCVELHSVATCCHPVWTSAKKDC